MQRAFVHDDTQLQAKMLISKGTFAPAFDPRALSSTPEHTAQSDVRRAKFILITGQAGTGKSRLVQELHGSRRINPLTRKPFGGPFLCSYVRRATDAKGGLTLHELLGLTVDAEKKFGVDAMGLATYLLQSKKKPLCSKLLDGMRVHTRLYVDEAFMISSLLMRVLFLVVEWAKATTRNTAFCLVLLGDQFQLGPPRYSDATSVDTRYWIQDACFMRHYPCAWVHLTRVFRQDSGQGDADERMRDFLCSVRHMRSIPSIIQTLSERQITLEDAMALVQTQSALMLTRTRDQSLRNNLMFVKEMPESKYFVTESREYSCTTNKQIGKEKYDLFAVGAKVIFESNDPRGAYCNGHSGVIVSVNDGIEDDLLEHAASEDDTIKFNKGTYFKGVKCINVLNVTNGKEVALKPMTRDIYGAHDRKSRYSVGWPLRLGYSTTVHSSQGLETDHVILQGIRGPGTLYTAISRSRTLSGVHILDLGDTEELIQHPERFITPVKDLAVFFDTATHPNKHEVDLFCTAACAQCGRSATDVPRCGCASTESEWRGDAGGIGNSGFNAPGQGKHQAYCGAAPSYFPPSARCPDCKLRQTLRRR